jgi:membrane-bound lytic murein transglycosylase D
MPASYTLAFIDNQDSICRYMADSLFNAPLVVEPTQIAKAPEPKPKYHYYKVRRGDTLSEIADRHNLTITKLKKLNGLRSSRLQPGQRLKVN